MHIKDMNIEDLLRELVDHASGQERRYLQRHGKISATVTSRQKLLLRHIARRYPGYMSENSFDRILGLPE